MSDSIATRVGLSCVVCHHGADKFSVDTLLDALKHDPDELHAFPWSDQDVKTGDRWGEFFSQEVQNAQVILFLVTKNILSSRFFDASSMSAIENSKNRGARVIAVSTDNTCSIPESSVLSEFEHYVVPDNALNFGADAAVATRYLELAAHISVTARKVLSSNNFFISHAHEDRLIADLSRATLREAGLGVWLETEELRVGHQYSTEIRASILDCVAVLVLVTPQALESHWVSYECGIATGADKDILPLIFKDPEARNGIWPQLESLQYLDFTSDRNQPWDALIARLDQIRQAAS